FGFAVDHLWTVGKGKREDAIEAAAGTRVEVGLPADHPHLPLGAPVYCSSSQAVKQHYQHARPKPGFHRVRKQVDIELVLTPSHLTVPGLVRPRRAANEPVKVKRTLTGPFPTARDYEAMERAARVSFEKLGQTHLELASFSFRNADGCFVPVSRLNQVRRDLV